jgi:hypothetical protein
MALYYLFIYVYIITMPYMLYNFLQLDMAEECLLHATDLSGLLLLYSSLGDAGGITKLASVAKEQGKNNVAFLCFFMLGKLEECLQLLIERYRHWAGLSCLIHLLVQAFFYVDRLPFLIQQSYSGSSTDGKILSS